MENANIYNDNVYDINSLNDIRDLDQIYLLANDEKFLKFRLGRDFFAYDKLNNSLLQFPDYKSLFENVNNKLIYDKGNKLNDYSENIVLGLKKLNFNHFKNFDLEKKDSFYLNENENGISIKLNGHKAKNANNKVNEFIDKFDAIKQKELKPVSDILKAIASMVSLFFLINLKKVKKEDNKIIELIIDELNANRIKIDDLLNDSNLLSRVPNLKKTLDEYKKNYVHDLDFSLDDNGFISHSPNNILLLNKEVEKIETLLLENKVEPFLLLGNPKNDTILNDIIPENNDTMSFIKDFIIKDNTLNYENYTSNEIAAGAILAGIKMDFNMGKFDLENNLFSDFKELIHTNDLDLNKVSILSDTMISKFTSFTLVDETIELKTNLK